jgi:hypothetical protein
MPQYSDDLFLGSAQTSMGTGLRANTSTFTGSVASTTLTVTAMLSGSPIVLGMYIDGTSITDGSYITAFGTGNGGTGTYTVSASSTASSTTITANTNAPFDNPSPMSVGVGPLGRIYVWDIVPQALVANNIAATQTPAAAGSLTLTAGTSVKSVSTPNGTVFLFACSTCPTLPASTTTHWQAWYVCRRRHCNSHDVRGTYMPLHRTSFVQRWEFCCQIAVGPNATRVGALGVTQA